MKSGVQTVLVANPRYHGKKPYFTRVILKVVPSAATRALLLRRGSVDVAETLGVDDLAALRSADGVKVLSIPDRNQYHLGLNAKRAPFDKVEVRQALSYAVPYDSIAKEVLRGQAATSASPIARAAPSSTATTGPTRRTRRRRAASWSRPASRTASSSI